MADEEVVVAATSVANSDNHKRKLEDLEQSAPGESVLKEEEAEPDSGEKADEEEVEGGEGGDEAQADGSEAKRPRLEEKADGLGILVIFLSPVELEAMRLFVMHYLLVV